MTNQGSAKEDTDTGDSQDASKNKPLYVHRSIFSQESQDIPQTAEESVSRDNREGSSSKPQDNLSRNIPNTEQRVIEKIDEKIKYLEGAIDWCVEKRTTSSHYLCALEQIKELKSKLTKEGG